MPKFGILDALRLKVFKELDTTDALRYKSGRVSVDNVPRSLFDELCETLRQWEAYGGQRGEGLWRQHEITKTRDGFNCRSSFAITTFQAAGVLLKLKRVEPDMESSLEYSSSLVKISNFRYGDVKFVDLPIQLEQLSSTSYGITTVSLELSFGIGVISNSSEPKLRRASGHPEFHQALPQSEYPPPTEWPLLPPYASSAAYMRYYIAVSILWGNMKLKELTEDREDGQLSFPDNIVRAARLWKQAGKPHLAPRQFWHHPKLTVAQCGGKFVPDHIVHAREAAAARAAQLAHHRRRVRELRQDRQKRISVLKKRVKAARKNGSRAEVKGLNDELYALESGNTA